MLENELCGTGQNAAAGLFAQLYRPLPERGTPRPQGFFQDNAVLRPGPAAVLNRSSPQGLDDILGYIGTRCVIAP